MELVLDIILIITGLVITLAAIFVSVISYSIYRRVNGILKSTKMVTTKIEALATVTNDEIGKPLFYAASLVQGIVCGIRAINKVYRKGE